MLEPRVITAGNSYEWSRSFGLYPASEWSLAYSIVDSVNQYSIDGANVTVDGDGFDIVLPAVLSATFAEGRYSIIGYVTKGVERKTVFRDEVTVKPNFTSAVDRRSYWQKVYDSCSALLLDRSASDVLASTIDGDSIQLMTPDQLMSLQDRAARELAREKDVRRARQAGRKPGTVRVRFK